MPGRILFNGQEIAPGLSADRAFHYGDGLFETLAVINGAPCLWELHIQRLLEGCRRLGLPLPDRDQLLAEAESLCSGQERAVLKLVISSGEGARGYARPTPVDPSRFLQIAPWPDPAHYQENLPLSVQWCETRLAEQPRLAGIKHLNRLEQVMARRELAADRHEGLMCDLHGQVIEGTSSNLLLKLDGRYLTPALSHCGVAGVVRRLILDRAAQKNIEVGVGQISPRHLESAERLFLTNSLLGIRPVERLGEQGYTHSGLGDDLLEAAHQACFTFSGAV